jgi:hypothetical protein
MSGQGGEDGVGGCRPRSEEGSNVRCFKGRVVQGAGGGAKSVAEGRRLLRVLDFVMRFGEVADPAGLARELKVIKDMRL